MSTPKGAFFFNEFKNSYIPEILDEIYIKKVYQPFLTGKKDLLIGDIGGNIGLTSYYFKDFAKEVFCIEPAKEHQDTIKKLIEYNKIDNITLCPYAISNYNGKTKFYHNENTTMFSLSELVNDKNDFEEVDVLSFDEFMARNKIDHLDLLKLDPEGEEGKIVTSQGFKEYAPKVKVIVGEWHNWANMEKGQFANAFRDLGYEFRWYNNTQASVYSAVRV